VGPPSTGPRAVPPRAVDAIVDALAKYIGPNMARTSVHGQCAKLGLSLDSGRLDQLEALVEALCPGLNVFIGRDKAKDVRAELIAVVRREES
jgi:hypothetical protein